MQSNRGWAMESDHSPRRDNAQRELGEVGEANSTELNEFSATATAAVKEYPAHGTQAARLLSALLRGRHVDPLAAWKALGIYRLSDTVFQLRGMGWPVITGRLDVANRFKESCHVAEYYLSPMQGIEAGQVGEDYVAEELRIMAEKAAA